MTSLKVFLREDQSAQDIVLISFLQGSKQWGSIEGHQLRCFPHCQRNLPLKVPTVQVCHCTSADKLCEKQAFLHPKDIPLLDWGKRVLRSEPHSYFTEHPEYWSCASKESSREGLSNDVQLIHPATADEALSSTLLGPARGKNSLDPLLGVVFSHPSAGRRYEGWEE